MLTSNRIGIFGGTFDPPHLGHTLACLWALETGEVDRVMMVPVGRHAYGKAPGASFEQRVAMCRLALYHLGAAGAVSTAEDRPGVSYMVDTLRLLQSTHPDAQFRLMVGTDVAVDVIKWREGAEVLRLAPPLPMPRPVVGVPLDQQPGALPPISSSQVRAELASGGDAASLLGHRVREYIRIHRLYSAASNP